MEKYTLEPEKCVGFDPFYKKYDCDIPEVKMHIYPRKETGVAKEQYGRPQTAGKNQIPISFCPWCGKKIEFT